MLEKAIHKYYQFFDETISSSTFIVLLISCLIFAAGSITTHANGDAYKGNIIEAMNKDIPTNIVVIEGIEYQLQLTKISK